MEHTTPAADIKLQTRLLLNLWDLGGVGEFVKKSELTNRVKKKAEKVSDYQKIYETLEQEGTIATKTEKRSRLVSLTETGLQRLAAGLQDPDFEYDAGEPVIGSRHFNALLKWVREMGDRAQPAGEGAIATYEAFKPVVLEVYHRLNRDYNYDDLVPIYRIRRELGERVARSHFSEWMLKLQVDGLWILQGGEMPDITPEKKEDSILTSLGELLYYATLL
ncbi:hypothetical protein [Lyngbya sp. CCY1209]|uniref:hypothetical protein n=1 Tax=Lyngbya sp. CCY1209 TaxID=2886103 RepID=UPI002D210295|nr:hypothetical protein [Lyngbya sp. CCY1209]MEB3885659.1 hypothetical protein [Lyngbya sp. CCY1209]